MRAESGLTLEEIAERTKISMRFLKSIEDEDFERLPGGVYTINYIRQYAAAIGYDATLLLAHCRRLTEPDLVEPGTATSDTASRGVIEWLRLLGSLQRHPTR